MKNPVISKIIAFLMLKGGVGKTTASVNSAVGLANKKYQVLLIDLDPQTSSTDYFMNDNYELVHYKNGVLVEESLESDLYDVLSSLNKETINKSIYNVKENLDLLPSSLELALLEYVLTSDKRFPTHLYLKKIIDLLEKEYDYIIIDCPPSLGLFTLNASMVSDLLVIPFKNDNAAFKGYLNTMSFLQEIKDNYEININSKILFTMTNRNNLDKVSSYDLKSVRFDTLIRNQAKPITENSINKTFVIEGKDNVSNDYKAFVDELELIKYV